MALITIPGSFLIPIGPNICITGGNPNLNGTTLLDAANEAMIFIGNLTTSDGGSHTINTTGSSSLGWRTGAVTFANGSTIVKVGLAAVDTGTGPPGRAVNASNVITFDVSKSLTGGSGITANAWQTHVPDSGSKTIANGDLVAFAVQMTARGGTDLINGAWSPAATNQPRPQVTSYIGASYTSETALPNAFITFSDGATGFFAAGEVWASFQTRTFNNASSPKEWGQLFQLPFPVTIYGIFGWFAISSDCDLVLYSNPLGTPVAERTSSFDANTATTASVRRFITQFSSPYSTTANQAIAITFKPGASNITAYGKTMASATHRISDVWGTNGYGVNRDTGAFADANASLEHYYMGLLVGAFDAGGSAGRAVQINNDSVVA